MGDRASAFAHGPDRARFRRTDTDSDNKATTTLYIGNVERVTHPDATVTVRRRIGGVAIELDGPAKGGCGADAVRYLLRDHLGSVDRLADTSRPCFSDSGAAAFRTCIAASSGCLKSRLGSRVPSRRLVVPASRAA